MVETSKDVNALAEPLGSFVRYAIVSARKQGKTITLVSGLRTKDQQIALRRAHCGTSEYDIWEKPASSCSPATARPGTSRHETGNAADLGGDKELAAQLMAPFNVDRRVPGEDWHFQYYGSDASTDVQKLGDAMRERNFTQTEAAEVVKLASRLDDGGGILADAFNFFSPFDTDDVVGVATAVADADPLAAINSFFSLLARPFTDAEFRNRLLIGLGGIALLVLAFNLLGRELIIKELTA